MIHLPGNARVSGNRLAPRVHVAGLCNELAEDEGDDCYASVLDLSPSGLRIERPHRGGLLAERVPLEFEVAEIDEVMWAVGEVCFDHVRKVEDGGRGRLVRTTGLRFVAAASRHLRLLRDYVLARTAARARERKPRPAVHAEACWTPSLQWARPCED